QGGDAITPVKASTPQSRWTDTRTSRALTTNGNGRGAVEWGSAGGARGGRRTAPTPSRTAAPPRSRPDRFTHASSSTRPTLPIRIKSDREYSWRNGLKPSGAARAAARWRRIGG